ncbi:MAG: transcriptional regulator [Gammaproteobacteria bacterium]|nr:transcriptional regulator [Gammaproteobacteria bacterium]
MEDDSFTLHKSKGNGILRRQIGCDDKGRITKYRLAYINHHLHHGDNGRVLGYDNAHGYHHRHYMGTVEPVNFISFTDIEERFQQEFEVLHEKVRKK